MILDGRGQITGHHLCRVMIDRQGEHMLGIDLLSIAISCDHRDGMGDHGHLQGMLGIVFRHGVPHETPAADQLQPGKISEKGKGHEDLRLNQNASRPGKYNPRISFR